MSAQAASSLPDASGHFGRFGGRFMPEALIAAHEELTTAWQDAMTDPAFTDEFERMLREYAGTPSLLCSYDGDVSELRGISGRPCDRRWGRRRPFPSRDW